MREIKYKAWDNDKKQMTKVFALDWTTDGNIISCHLEYKNGSIEKKYPEKDYCDDIELLQYIGIKDKNNDEIYEGYIVRCYGGEHCQGYWQYDETITIDSINNPFTILSLTEIENVEIVGNIYENPELLN